MSKDASQSSWLEKMARSGILIVAVAPVLHMLFVLDVRVKYLVIGSGSWGIGCLLKLAIYHLLIRRLGPPRFSNTTVAFLNGLSSGLCELGVAVAAFAYLGSLNLREVIAFGIGIGSFEAWIVGWVPNLLQGTAVEEKSNELEVFVRGLPARQRVLYEGIAPIVERIFATMAHVGTRALIYATVVTGNAIPAVLALSAFVMLDGFIGYRFLLERKAITVRALWRVYVSFGACAVIMVVVGLYYAARVAVKA